MDGYYGFEKIAIGVASTAAAAPKRGRLQPRYKRDFDDRRKRGTAFQMPVDIVELRRDRKDNDGRK
jgi:hypothetical protein